MQEPIAISTTASKPPQELKQRVAPPGTAIAVNRRTFPLVLDA